MFQNTPRAPRPRGPYVLGPFETPGRPYRFSHIKAWRKVGLGIGSSDHLWGSLWRRFNTIRIPIFGEEDYFNYAMEIAKLANGNAEEFERIYAQRNKDRMGELLDLLTDAAENVYQARKAFCRDAREKVRAVCQTGSLEDFAQLLKGVAFGWEADTAEDVQADFSSSSSSESSDEEMPTCPVVQANPYGYHPDDVRLTAYYESLCPTSDAVRLNPEYDYSFPDGIFPGDVEEMGGFPSPLSVDLNLRPRKTATEIAAETTESTLYETADEAPPPASSHASPMKEWDGQGNIGKGEQAQPTTNTDNCQHQSNNLESLAPPTIAGDAHSRQSTTDKRMTLKEPGINDAGNNDLESQGPHSPPARAARGCASSSSQAPHGGSVAMKRARFHEQSDEDHTEGGDGDRSGKRRKTKKPPSPQAAKGDRQRGGNEQYSSPRKPRAKAPASSATSTRSRRGNRASTLWELDQAGRPQSLS